MVCVLGQRSIPIDAYREVVFVCVFVVRIRTSIWSRSISCKGQGHFYKPGTHSSRLQARHMSKKHVKMGIVLVGWHEDTYGVNRQCSANGAIFAHHNLTTGLTTTEGIQSSESRKIPSHKIPTVFWSKYASSFEYPTIFEHYSGYENRRYLVPKIR